MKFKQIFAIILIFLASYLILPILILKFSTADLNKSAFAILLILAFLSFALNLFFTYKLGKRIQIPLISLLISIGLFFIFNKSVIVLILIIAFLSFLGYFLGTITTKKEL